MKIEELLTVINSNAYLNIVFEGSHWISHWLYEGKAIFIPSDLLERKVKSVDIIRNEFFIVLED